MSKYHLPCLLQLLPEICSLSCQTCQSIMCSIYCMSCLLLLLELHKQLTLGPIIYFLCNIILCHVLISALYIQINNKKLSNWKEACILTKNQHHFDKKAKKRLLFFASYECKFFVCTHKKLLNEKGFSISKDKFKFRPFAFC